ncbi:MAG: hypothetical protein H6512_08370 [Acidimicrobiia bacterium]|nr:hypothetical protein [Acidimicrobiia bacterium]
MVFLRCSFCSYSFQSRSRPTTSSEKLAEYPPQHCLPALLHLGRRCLCLHPDRQFAGRLHRRPPRRAYSAEGNERGRKLALLASLVLNLGSLGYFKYSNWIVGQFNDVAAHFGWGQIAWHNVALPIGISFFTFQSMSYTLDIAAVGRTDEELQDFLLYVTLFPQLIAGPIVRYHELADQLVNRTATVDSFSAGAVRFAHGLFKKVVIADSIGSISDAAFSLGPDQLNTRPPGSGAGFQHADLFRFFGLCRYGDRARFVFRFPLS